MNKLPKGFTEENFKALPPHVQQKLRDEMAKSPESKPDTARRSFFDPDNSSSAPPPKSKKSSPFASQTPQTLQTPSGSPATGQAQPAQKKKGLNEADIQNLGEDAKKQIREQLAKQLAEQIANQPTEPDTEKDEHIVIDPQQKKIKRVRGKKKGEEEKDTTPTIKNAALRIGVEAVSLAYPTIGNILKLIFTRQQKDDQEQKAKVAKQEKEEVQTDNTNKLLNLFVDEQQKTLGLLKELLDTIRGISPSSGGMGTTAVPGSTPAGVSAKGTPGAVPKANLKVGSVPSAGRLNGFGKAAAFVGLVTAGVGAAYAGKELYEGLTQTTVPLVTPPSEDRPTELASSNLPTQINNPSAYTAPPKREERSWWDKFKSFIGAGANDNQEGEMVNPVDYSRISTAFSDAHHGVDFPVPEGTPVKAATDGTITSIRPAPGGGYGNVVDLTDDSGKTTTRYAHLSEFKVNLGQKVKAGDVIALSGNTGMSTGPHLHFEVLKDGTPVDPMSKLSGLTPADNKATDSPKQAIASPAGSAPTKGREILHASTTNSIAGSTWARPKAVVSMPNFSHAQNGLNPTTEPINDTDPGNVEPLDANTRYPRLFEWSKVA